MKSLLLMIFSATSFLQVSAQDTTRTYIITNDTVSQQFLDNNYWQVLQDKNSRFTIADVQKKPLSNQFIYFTKNSKDNSAKTTWFRFNIKNNSGKPIFLSIASDAGEANFYIPDSNGIIRHFLTGKEIPWNKKEGFKKDNAISFELKQEDQKILYLQTVNHTSFLSVDLKFSLFYTDIAQRLPGKLYRLL